MYPLWNTNYNKVACNWSHWYIFNRNLVICCFQIDIISKSNIWKLFEIKLLFIFILSIILSIIHMLKSKMHSVFFHLLIIGFLLEFSFELPDTKRRIQNVWLIYCCKYSAVWKAHKLTSSRNGFKLPIKKYSFQTY